jgi:hypothetical protein
MTLVGLVLLLVRHGYMRLKNHAERCRYMILFRRDASFISVLLQARVYTLRGYYSEPNTYLAPIVAALPNLLAVRGWGGRLGNLS